MKRPQPLKKSDIEQLKKSYREYMKFLFGEDYCEDEAALEAIYGNDIWSKINSRTQ